MSVLNTFTKQPADVLDYDIEYVGFLSPGDSVLSGVATVEPAGLVVQTPIKVGTTLKLWISGGTHGTKYKVTVTATTALGRTKQDELLFKVKDV